MRIPKRPRPAALLILSADSCSTCKKSGSTELKPLCRVEKMAASEVEGDLERLLLKYVVVRAEPYERPKRNEMCHGIMSLTISKPSFLKTSSTTSTRMCTNNTTATTTAATPPLLVPLLR